MSWGFPIDARGDDGATPLHTAAAAGSVDVTRLLIDRGADVQARDTTFGSTPAVWASIGSGMRLRPHAEQLHHVLQSLEGHYLVGYGGRRTSKVQDLRPIRLTDGSADDANQWVRANDEEAQGRIEAFLQLADGYETPYSLELSATVHFAAASRPGADKDALVEIVRGWSGRKARSFTADHVRTAYGRLLRDHVLPHSPSRRT